MLRPSPDPTRYGSVQVVWVREYWEQVGLLRFPDGGRARDVALYAIVYQYPAGHEAGEADAEQRREVARTQLKSVRRWDYGNLGWGSYEWVAPDRFRYRQEYGYPPEWKVAEPGGEQEDLQHIGIIYRVEVDRTAPLRIEPDGIDSLGARWIRLDQLEGERLSPLAARALGLPNPW